MGSRRHEAGIQRREILCLPLHRRRNLSRGHPSCNVPPLPVTAQALNSSRHGQQRDLPQNPPQKKNSGQIMLRGLPEGRWHTRMYSVIAFPPQQRSGGGAGVILRCGWLAAHFRGPTFSHYCRPRQFSRVAGGNEMAIAPASRTQ